MTTQENQDNHLWIQAWHQQQTEFHAIHVNPMLMRFWPRLELPAESRVLVPLCGKSLDMLWLAEQGLEVVGIELSPIAAEAFFQENGLVPLQQRQGPFTLWRAGRITILCGDYFALQAADVGPIDAIYDRAALTALPEAIRAGYVAQLSTVAPGALEVLLLTVEDAEEGESLVQAMGIAQEIAALYSSRFDIALAHVESIFEADPKGDNQPDRRVEYKVYRFSRRVAARRGG